MSAKHDDVEPLTDGEEKMIRMSRRIHALNLAVSKLDGRDPADVRRLQRRLQFLSAMTVREWPEVFGGLRIVALV